jgi:predicted hotdog family 3-hydroxylacyl-ACP dehydratase
MALPAPIDLLPHRPPMLLIDEVVAWKDRKITCRARIGPDHPFLEGDRVSSMLAIELFAQSAGALVGLAGRERADADISGGGALLGTREIVLEQPWLAIGDELLVECEELWASEGAAQVGCVLRRDGETIARGSVNVFAGVPR